VLPLAGIVETLPQLDAVNRGIELQLGLSEWELTYILVREQAMVRST